MTDQWSLIYNAFNPYEPVPPDRLDDWYVERPKSPLRRLLTELRPEKDITRFLLVGHPASGKSTELVKLGAELQKRYNFFVVRINLEENLDIEKCNPLEVLFLVGAAIYKVAHEELPDGEKPDRHLLEDLEAGLETLVRSEIKNEKFEINLDRLLEGLICASAGFIYAGPLGAVVGAALGRSVAQVLSRMVKFTSGTEVEVVKKREVEPQIEEMVRQLNAIIADVEEKAGRQLLLLVDGLDKPKDLEIVALNFEDKPFLSDVGCRVLYTAPIWVAYHTRFKGVRGRFAIRAFPNVKLYELKDPSETDDEGYSKMEAVAYKRLRHLGLEPEKLLPKLVLTPLIQGSGGVMRDFIRLVRDAATEAEMATSEHIGKDQAKNALLDLHRQLSGGLRPRHHLVINEVHDKHELTDAEECDALVQGNLILSYTNDFDWWDAHPILWSVPWGP